MPAARPSDAARRHRKFTPYHADLHRALCVLALLSSVWLPSVCGAPPGALPPGTFTALPFLPVNYVSPLNAQVIVRNATIVVGPDGTAFSFYGSYAVAGVTDIQSASFTGEAVCAGGSSAKLLISVNGESCSATKGFSAWFCSNAPELYSGTLDFGLSINALPTIVTIDRWGGAQWPFILSCVLPSNACGKSSTCNSTSVNTNNVFITGGNNTFLDSNAYIDNGTANFFGDQLNVQQSNNVQLNFNNQSTTVEVNVEGDENNFNISSPQTLNFFTSSSSTCEGWVYWNTYRPANSSLTTANAVRIFTTATGSFVSNNGDWDLADASTLRFVGDDDDPLVTGYTFTMDFQDGYLFGGDNTGMRVRFMVYNLTGVDSPLDANSYASSAVIYNHTNPSFIGGSSSQISITGVRTGDTFGVYALLQTTNGISAIASLEECSLAISVMPTACQGNIVNYNFSLVVNGSHIEPGVCMSKEFIPGNNTIVFNNDGVCTIEVEIIPGPSAAYKHATENWFLHKWHVIKSWALGATQMLSGNIKLIDTRTQEDEDSALTIQPRSVDTTNEIQFLAKCPLNCGNQNITSNKTCSCKEKLETEGTCDCELGVTATNGTCNCENGVETAGSCECSEGVQTDGPVETPELITPQISSPSALPIIFTNGISLPSPAPVTIIFNVQQSSTTRSSSSSSSLSSSSSSSSGSSGSSGGASGSSGIPGVPGVSDCSGGSLGLNPEFPLVAVFPNGLRLPLNRRHLLGLVGGVVSAATHAASSAASSASSAASSAASAATSVAAAITGLLNCKGGGFPTPGGIPGLGDPLSAPSPGVDAINSALSAAISAAFASSTSSSISPDPQSLAANAAGAAVAASSGGLPDPAPTFAVVWSPGLQLPVVNNNDTHPPCNSLYRRSMEVVEGASADGDRLEICLNRSANGTKWYEIPIGTALYADIFRGNGSGLTCNPLDCVITAYPNGSLYDISLQETVLPGSCVNCNITVDAKGRVTYFSSGDNILTGNVTNWINAIVRIANSAFIFDANSTIVNAGPTVLADVQVTAINSTTYVAARSFKWSNCTNQGNFAFGAISGGEVHTYASISNSNCGAFTWTWTSWAAGAVILMDFLHDFPVTLECVVSVKQFSAISGSAAALLRSFSCGVGDAAFTVYNPLASPLGAGSGVIYWAHEDFEF